MGRKSFDYACAAELYVTGKARHGRKSMVYRRFESSADAIQYSMEELPRAKLLATTLEVDGERFVHTDIRRLYESRAYPLARVAPKAEAEAGAAPPSRGA